MHLTTEPVVPREQFLGEIETEVVGHPRRQGEIRPGEYVELQREPENPRPERHSRGQRPISAGGLCVARHGKLAGAAGR